MVGYEKSFKNRLRLGKYNRRANLSSMAKTPTMLLSRVDVLAMSVNRKKAIERLSSEGMSKEGFIYHLAKVILWYNRDDTWYGTLCDDCAALAALKLKPSNDRLDKKLVMQNLFNPLCENQNNLLSLLNSAEIMFREKMRWKSRLKDLDMTKTWKAFEQFRDKIIYYICEADEETLIEDLTRAKIKELCKCFENITKDGVESAYKFTSRAKIGIVSRLRQRLRERQQSRLFRRKG